MTNISDTRVQMKSHYRDVNSTLF